MNVYMTVKGVSFFKKHWKELLIFFMFLFMLPVIIATSFVVAKTVPAADNEIIKKYSDAANSVSREGAVVDWRNLMAIDAVRYNQELKDIKKGDIASLGERFIEEYTEEVTTTTTNSKGEEITKTQTVTKYRTKTLEQVMNEMGFSEEEKISIKTYRDVGLNLIGGSGINGELIDISGINGQPVDMNMSEQEFINQIAPGAISTYKKYKIFPSISIAQAILESGWGKSELSAYHKNLFGIKAYNWSGKYVEMWTGETYGGSKVQIVAPFRVYDSWADSIEDHGVFLVENSRYAEAGIFNATDYKDQAVALQRAGYATDPDYARLLIEFVQMYSLDKYDKIN